MIFGEQIEKMKIKERRFFGSVEILRRNNQSLLGALFYIVLLAPAARASRIIR